VGAFTQMLQTIHTVAGADHVKTGIFQGWAQ